MATRGDYQPLTVGATWTYAVQDATGPYQKTSVSETIEDMGGPKAGMIGTRIREMLANTVQVTWYAPNGDAVLRHHELNLDPANNDAKISEDWYDPGYLRVDGSPEHTAAGASWDETYTDNHESASKGMSSSTVNVHWTVEAVDEPIGVPAGNFNALKLKRADVTSGSSKTFWFVRGIGKVREQGDNLHIEELTAYSGL